MYRLIEFRGTIALDEQGKFSHCSTNYTVWGLYPANCNPAQVLSEHALKRGISVSGKPFKVENTRSFGIKTNWALKRTEVYESKSWNAKEEYAQYIGLVDLSGFENDTLKPIDATGFKVEWCDSSDGAPVTKEQANAIVNNQEYGVSSMGELVDGGYTLVKQAWDCYHFFPLLGYSRKSFLEALEITDEGFEDDTVSCDECGKYDSVDNGYTYNHRIVQECTQLGINCGCFDEYSKNVDAFADDPEHAIERRIADELADQGKLKHVGQFVGGMTDPNRYHSYDGTSARISDPKTVLAELKKKFPSRCYVFSHDESGQFQTYFSVWQIAAKRGRFKKTG